MPPSASRWRRHGQAETEKAGLDCDYVPHCYDPTSYYPDDASAARKYLDAEGRFVVGVVAANKGTPGAPHRKSFVQIVEGFKAFHQKHPEALLYLHAYSRSNLGGLDLNDLCRHYEMPQDAVRIADPYLMHLGLPVEMMRGLYNAMDVLLSPSMGEGFGVPILEAQACGTPVITGDWTAMPEITLSGLAIPKEYAFRYYWPGYSYEWIVYPQAVTGALDEAWEWRMDRTAVAAQVAEYQADTVCATYWPPVLEKLERHIAEARTIPQVGLNRQQRRALARQK